MQTKVDAALRPRGSDAMASSPSGCGRHCSSGRVTATRSMVGCGTGFVRVADDSPGGCPHGSQTAVLGRHSKRCPSTMALALLHPEQTTTPPRGRVAMRMRVLPAALPPDQSTIAISLRVNEFCGRDTGDNKLIIEKAFYWRLCILTSV